MSVELKAPSQRMELARLVGEDAAATTHRAFRWQLSGVAGWVIALAGLGTVNQLATPAPAYLVLLVTVPFLIVQGRAIQLYLQGARLASTYLSQVGGAPVRVRGFSLQPRVWQKQIAKSDAQRSQREPTS